MVKHQDYQMAIDLLCCHLGISEDEAKQQLGLNNQQSQEQITESQLGYMLLSSEL